LKVVQPQIGFTMDCIRSMARKAAVGKNRSHITIEIRSIGTVGRVAQYDHQQEPVEPYKRTDVAARCNRIRWAA
jgi:hypothetical protein